MVSHKEARLSTTLGSDIETNIFCGQVSTVMRVISIKDGDLLSQFDNIDENDIPVLERLVDLPPQIRSTPHQKMLTNNHTDANKGQIKDNLYLEDIFGFCKSFEEVTKNLGFHLMFKTANLQDFICTSMTDDINVTINSLYLYIPNLIPSVMEISPQGPIIWLMFDNSIRDILRFNAGTFFEEYNLSTNPVDTISFNNIFIETDIAKGIISKGKRSGIKMKLTMSFSPRYIYVRRFGGGIQRFMTESKVVFLSISFKLKK